MARQRVTMHSRREISAVANSSPPHAAGQDRNATTPHFQFGWLEVLFVLASLSLLVQLFPQLISYPWSLLKPIVDRLIWCADVRNWNWKGWLAAEACLLVFLLFLKKKYYSE
jgi:hypothetical protein